MAAVCVFCASGTGIDGRYLDLASAFGSDQVWSLRPTREGNTVVIAGRGVVVPDRDTLSARADNIEARFGLPARKWLRMVRPLTL